MSQSQKLMLEPDCANPATELRPLNFLSAKTDSLPQRRSAQLLVRQQTRAHLKSTKKDKTEHDRASLSAVLSLHDLFLP